MTIHFFDEQELLKHTPEEYQKRAGLLIKYFDTYPEQLIKYPFPIQIFITHTPSSFNKPFMF